MRKYKIYHTDSFTNELFGGNPTVTVLDADSLSDIETFNFQNHIHARGFAPLVGVPEDPFTGSMQGGLAAYAFNQKIIKPMQWIGVEQGHFIERPGSVKLEVTQTIPIHVRLHSEAVTVFASEITLP